MSLKPIPTFLYYSSRLMAESWDSNNLYWARLADEMGYSPVMLNGLVPQLTRRMVEQTFASPTWKTGRRCCERCGKPEKNSGKAKSRRWRRADPSAGLLDHFSIFRNGFPRIKQDSQKCNEQFGDHG